MGRTVALRLCPDHDRCQLESVDDGPWQHTPQGMPTALRLAPPPPDLDAIAFQAEAVARRLDKDAGRITSGAATVEAQARQLDATDARVSELTEELERRIPQLVTDVEQRAADIGIITAALQPEIERIGERLSDVHRLEQVGALYQLLEESTSEWRAGLKALGARLDIVEHDIRKEREERLAAVRKSSQQARNLARLIEKKETP